MRPVASRYPTRNEWVAMVGDTDELSGEALRLAEKAGAAEPRQKLRKLTRRRRLQQERRPGVSNLDVWAVLPENEYLALKQRVYDRAGRLCERCGTGRRRLTPHHRKLLSQGGRDEITNMLSLCSICHDEVHDEPTDSMVNGWIVPSYGDPAAEPVLLFDGRKVLLTDAGGYELAA